jgi:hypothetical protein
MNWRRETLSFLPSLQEWAYEEGTEPHFSIVRLERTNFDSWQPPDTAAFRLGCPDSQSFTRS